MIKSFIPTTGKVEITMKSFRLTTSVLTIVKVKTMIKSFIPTTGKVEIT